MAATSVRRDAYTGELKNHLRDGYGTYNFENKFFRYEGEWKGGKKHGHGKLIMADGSYYEGEFEEGEIEGHGFRYFAPSSNEYSGQFHEGELHGQGVMKYGNGAMYEGEWVRNRRQGYGVMRRPDNSVYQGYLYNNLRHGEGTLIYGNGDRYDGEWVNDVRQGHGESRDASGTLFIGQWRNDVFNGQGTMQHSSGMVYEGLWINGKPSNIAAKLHIKAVTTPLELTQGLPFAIEIEVHTEDGEVVAEDVGRELQIIAGYKHDVPKPKKETKSTKDKDKEKEKESSSTALFEVIEDVEDKPIPTPFGYDVTPYPITDQYNLEEMQREASTLSLPGGGLAHSKTDLSEIAIREDETLETTEQPIAEEEKEKEEKLSAKEDASSITQTVDRAESPSAASNTLIASSEHLAAPPDGAPAPDGSTLPAPANNLRTEEGMGVFQNLILPAPPPMYRPFQTPAEEEPSGRKSQKSRAGSRKTSDAGEESRPSTRSKKLGDERFARPASRSTRSTRSVATTPDQSDSLSDVTSEPEYGDYVIMVSDVTSPPFFGYNLEPAFVQIKLAIPKKVKTRSKSKEKGPRWDTSKHITGSTARSMGAIAQAEIAEALRASQSSLSNLSST